MARTKRDVNTQYSDEERQRFAMQFVKVYHKYVENRSAQKVSNAQYKDAEKEILAEMNRLDHIVKTGCEPVAEPAQSELDFGGKSDSEEAFA